MTKKCLLLLLLSYCWVMSSAQQYDKVWAVGAHISTLTFDTVNDTVLLNYLQNNSQWSFNTISSICDKDGNFLFCTNGVRIFNREGNIMPNGDSLSYPCTYYNLVFPDGASGRQNAIILPDPGDSSLYYVFHYSPVDTEDILSDYEALNLYYSVVDTRLDSGRGDVAVKNHSIMHAVMSPSRLCATRHANGRDWWIVKNAYNTNRYYTFLLDPEGVHGPYVQDIGPDYGIPNTEEPAYSTFSPDGAKYASVTAVSYVVLMDFDRCSGTFSHPDSIYNNDSGDPVHHPTSGGVGLSFSNNSQYLYVCNSVDINQYDLLAQRLNDSVRIFTDTEFFRMNILQLAPNGKMYISCWAGGSYNIHVIDYPDSFGTACHFRFFGQPVSQLNSIGIPYFPNFRLERLLGSDCDTLTGLDPSLVFTDGEATIRVQPNPAGDAARLSYPPDWKGTKDVAIYDNLGREALRLSGRGDSGVIDLDLSSLPAGIYTLSLSTRDRGSFKTRLSVIR